MHNGDMERYLSAAIRRDLATKTVLLTELRQEEYRRPVLIAKGADWLATLDA